MRKFGGKDGTIYRSSKLIYRFLNDVMSTTVVVYLKMRSEDDYEWGTGNVRKDAFGSHFKLLFCNSPGRTEGKIPCPTDISTG